MDFSQSYKTNSNEAKDLLHSLPTCHAWGLDLCLYKGQWQMSYSLNAILLVEKKFQTKDTDIVLVTMPKSGTTWLKSLVFAITRRTRYPVSDPNHPLHAANSHELVPFIHYLYGESEDPDLSHLPSPRLYSMHTAHDILSESVKATEARIIYLCRDPKDNFVSLWHFHNKLVQQRQLGTDDKKAGAPKAITLNEAFELFCKGISPRGPIWDHALGYWNASLKAPQKVLFLKYEDLKCDIVSQVKKIADFTGFPFTAKEESEGVVEQIVKLCSFESLSNLKVNGRDGKRVIAFTDNTICFRKGQTGDWVNYLTPAMAEKLDQITEEKFKGTGLKFK